MKYMTYFYVAIDILLVVYACYIVSPQLFGR